eukprot:TRINITY_DN13365_c0_g1_i1.p1 TRINITY_DN13365_c0_g1~~TRINITY_DN13365_c0_g1_i1.p1  ORF type:complete len:165 (+),score=32.25 TRINITY_DN13365_c0_g1_i1:124-618(+)
MDAAYYMLNVTDKAKEHIHRASRSSCEGDTEVYQKAKETLVGLLIGQYTADQSNAQLKVELGEALLLIGKAKLAKTQFYEAGILFSRTPKMSNALDAFLKAKNVVLPSDEEDDVNPYELLYWLGSTSYAVGKVEDCLFYLKQAMKSPNEALRKRIESDMSSIKL